MNATGGGKGKGNYTLVILGLAVACVVLLVVLIVLGAIYLTSDDTADVIPTDTATVPPVPTTPVPGEEDEWVPIIPETTKVLTGETMGKLISVSDDGAVYTFSETTAELQALALGDVIVGDAWEQTPQGFLRKVTGISGAGGQVVLATEQARLEDAIEQGSVVASQELTPADVRAGTELPGVLLAYAGTDLGPGGFVVDLDNVVLFDLDGKWDTTDDQVRANGQVLFQPRFSFDLKLRGFRIERLSAVAGATERVDLSVEADVQLLDVQQRVTVARYFLSPITVWVGWVPVVLTPRLNVDVGLDGTAQLAFDMAVVQEANLDAGLQYANGSWSPIASFTNDFDYTPPTISADCNVRGYGRVGVAILIYGVGGPYGQLDGFMDLDADLNRVPWFELYGGLGATVGVQFDVLGYHLADRETRVLEKRISLTTSGNEPPIVTPPTPTFTPTPTVTPSVTPTATPTPTPTYTPTPIPCTIEAQGLFAGLWEFYRVELGCPNYPNPSVIQDAEQPFENGHMFWRQDHQVIYVVYESGPRAGTYEVFTDEWEEGDPEYSCAATPPTDLLQPKRGFGVVWCNLGGATADIGWALEEELGFWGGYGDPLVQDFDSGVIFRDSAGTASGQAYVLFSDTGTFEHVSY